jgi:hypothetical protein
VVLKNNEAVSERCVPLGACLFLVTLRSVRITTNKGQSYDLKVLAEVSIPLQYDTASMADGQ